MPNKKPSKFLALSNVDFNKLDLIWLLLCLSIGIVLRFFNLDTKSLASIELASLGFSLGHGFLQVPIDRPISISELLAPLNFDPHTNPSDTLRYLISESTHPPLYFLLNHFWLKLLSPQTELELLHAGRSLSAIFGAITIPATFTLGYLAFRSRLVAHLAAALMAVSPYGIYLSQEARHYTLTILWIIASLCCLILALTGSREQGAGSRKIREVGGNNRQPLPISIVCLWVIVNSLGIATHYFFSLTLCAEALVIFSFWLKDLKQCLLYCKKNLKSLPYVSSAPLPLRSSAFWYRIYAAAAGTIVGCLVWYPYAKTVSGNEITEWITTSLNIQDLWEPIARMLGWLLSMIALLPVEGVNLVVIICSAIILLSVLLWVTPVLINSFRSQLQDSQLNLSVKVLGSFFLAAIALFLVIIYVLRRDLSLAARYHFVYFPAVIVLLASALATCISNTKLKNVGDKSSEWRFAPIQIMCHSKSKQKVILLLAIGLLGALTVVSNYGFQKSKRADLLVDRIQNLSQVPVVIATTYKTHSEIRELMSVAFELKRSPESPKNNLNPPQFLLARKNNDNSDRLSSSLRQIINQKPKPFDLWTTNLQAKTEAIEALNCQQNPQKIKIKGYKTRLYHCRHSTTQ
jgi:uncharacterized membrane protein